MKKGTRLSTKDPGKTKARSLRLSRLSGGNGSPDKAIQRVLPLGNGWVVKSDKSKKFTVVTETRKEAVDIAKSIAKNQQAELIIHAKDGTVKSAISYAILADAKKGK